MAQVKYIFPYWDDSMDDDETPSSKNKENTFSDSFEDE